MKCISKHGPTVHSIVSGASNEHPESAPSPIEIVPMSSITSRRAADADEIEVVSILRSQYARDQNRGQYAVHSVHV